MEANATLDDAMASASGSGMLQRFLLFLEAQGLSPGTLELYAYIISRWQRSGIADPAEYLAGLPSRRMRSQHGIILRRYFRWCIEAGYVADNPLAGLRFRAPRPQPIRPFGDEEISRLLDACQTPLETAVIIVLLETGIRASELCGLRWADVLQGGVLRIRGKGDKVRFVALSERALAALQCVSAKDGYMFGLDYRRLYRMMAAVGKRAGITDCHPHRYRHTFAHRFLSKGGNIGDLRVLLGHASFQMTARYVAFHEGERAVAAHRRFLAKP